MIRSFANSRIPAAFGVITPSGRVRSAGFARPAGQLATGQPDQSAAPASQGDQQFKLMTLPFPNYNITDPNGTVINPISVPQLRTGALMHWIDIDLAAACFAEARKQMDIAVDAAGKDTSNDDAGLIAMHKAMSWIMTGYNALNVPWYMDPVARSLYRQFISGPPQQVANLTTPAEFGSGLPNYNNDWFVPGHIDPGFSQSSISQQMKDLISKVPELNDPSTMQVPTIWPITVIPQDLGGPGLASKDPWAVSLTLGGGGNTTNAADPTYAQNIQNHFLFNQFQNEQDYSIVIPPIYCETNLSNPRPNCQSRYWKYPAGPNIDNDHPFAGVKNGSWRTFSWQNTPFNPKLISTPLIFYVPWLDAWSWVGF